jgi:hypothetical protein
MRLRTTYDIVLVSKVTLSLAFGLSIRMPLIHEQLQEPDSLLLKTVWKYPNLWYTEEKYKHTLKKNIKIAPFYYS